MLILFGDRDHEAQIGFHQFVLGAFSFTSSAANSLSKLDLFIDGNHWDTTNLYQVFVQCFTGTVGDAFLNLKLTHDVIFDL